MPRTPPADPSPSARALVCALVKETEAAGLRQKDVARAIGSGQQHVSAIYRYRAEVKSSELFAWCTLLGVPLSEVIRRAEALANLEAPCTRKD